MVHDKTLKQQQNLHNVEYVAMARHMSVTLREAADCDGDELAMFGDPAMLPGSAAAI